MPKLPETPDEKWMRIVREHEDVWGVDDEFGEPTPYAWIILIVVGAMLAALTAGLHWGWIR